MFARATNRRGDLKTGTDVAAPDMSRLSIAWRPMLNSSVLDWDEPEGAQE
jgi:hypothetical protein